MSIASVIQFVEKKEKLQKPWQIDKKKINKSSESAIDKQDASLFVNCAIIVVTSFI